MLTTANPDVISRRCANPRCLAPFETLEKSTQKYCDPECRNDVEGPREHTIEELKTWENPRARSRDLPSGWIPACEVAERIGISPVRVGTWLKQGVLPGERIHTYLTAFHWDTVKTLPVVVEALKRKEAADAAPRRMWSAPPAYIPPPPEVIPEPVITLRQPEQAPTEFAKRALENARPAQAPESMVEPWRFSDEYRLFLAARGAAKPLIECAKRCRTEGKTQAEAELLWLALENLGFT
jgi:hypothetical protein